MKKLILFLWVFTLMITGLVFIQNQTLFITEQSISINLVLHQFSFPAVQNGLIILLFFFIGVLLSFATVTVSRFRARNALKKCRTLGDGYVDRIGELKVQIEQLKNRCDLKDAGFRSSAIGTASGGGLPSA